MSETYGDWNKALSAEEYINKIRPYLKDITNISKNLILQKSNQ